MPEMKNPYAQIAHRMELDNSWQQDFIDVLQAKRINARQLVLPDELASGCSYFVEVMPGLMVLIVDFVFHRQIEITRLASDGEFCIAYYDLSDEISVHQVNDTKHSVGYRSKLGMGLIDAAIKSSYEPPVSERMYSFRLLISKDILKKYLGGIMPEWVAEQAFDRRKNSIFFYSHIDSRTRLALHKLKERHYDDPSFELTLKGAALQAFGYLIQRMSETGPVVLGHLSEADKEQVMHTKDHLMAQLLETFPGIDFLADMAGMSVSKYNKIFKKLFKNSPNNFFLKEKMFLAQELLKSGNFNTINEVAYELGYGKPGYFAEVYKKNFGRLPGEIFVKTQNHP